MSGRIDRFEITVMNNSAPVKIRIGTRASQLARMQACEVRRELLVKLDLDESDVTISEFTTLGDRVMDKPFRMLGEKGVFCKEIEAALIKGQIDVGVHSLKDMPVAQPEGLTIAAYLQRESPLDALITDKARSIDALPKGSRIGTSSIRRHRQIIRANNDVEVVSIRGNIQTRIKKWEDGIIDGLILALAGLNRMQLTGLPRIEVPMNTMLPAPGQGTICVECRSDDIRMISLLNRINHAPTKLVVEAERSFLRTLAGSCDLPVGSLATIEDGKLILRGEFYSDRMEKFVTRTEVSPLDRGVELGHVLAETLLEVESRCTTSF